MKTTGNPDEGVHEAATLPREILFSRRSTPSFVPHGARCPNLSSEGLIAAQSGRPLRGARRQLGRRAVTRLPVGRFAHRSQPFFLPRSEDRFGSEF